MSLSGCRSESVMMRGMVIDMEEARLHTIAQVRAFLDGATEIAFRVPKVERYPFIEGVLTRFGYAAHGRVGKGVLLRYLARLTGLSRQQVTRLVRQYCQEGTLSTRYGPPRHGFRRRYTATDVAVLADVDALHSTLSGPATKKLMERAFQVFGDTRFERLAGISVSHLYNLRRGTPYQRTRRHWTKTRPTGVPIGQRRAPQPNGIPGYIRIDSVHQGDQDGVKGVYHINAVDSVTQFQLVATCEKISEAYMLPVIRQLLEGFLFSFWDSMRITAQSTSIIKSRRCWRSCASSSPSPAPGIPTIMPWQNPRTAPLKRKLAARSVTGQEYPTKTTPSSASRRAVRALSHISCRSGSSNADFPSTGGTKNDSSVK